MKLNSTRVLFRVLAQYIALSLKELPKASAFLQLDGFFYGLSPIAHGARQVEPARPYLLPVSSGTPRSIRTSALTDRGRHTKAPSRKTPYRLHPDFTTL